MEYGILIERNIIGISILIFQMMKKSFSLDTVSIMEKKISF